MTHVLQQVLEDVAAFSTTSILSEIFGAHLDAVQKGALPVVLFCAGSSGQILCAFLREQGIHPVCFCDNDTARVGAVYCGLPIISFSQLKRDHAHSLILLATTAYQDALIRQLLESGFEKDRILALDNGDGSYDQVLKREQLLMLARNGDPANLVTVFQQDEDQIQAAYHLMADDQSKALYMRRLALMASGFEYHLYKQFLLDFSEPVRKCGYAHPDRFQYNGNYFYFNNAILKLENKEILIDGGAFTGDTTEQFMAACRQRQVTPEHIYCFEPDPGNFATLRKTMSPYHHVTCLNYGLWSHGTTLRFVSSATIAAYGARIQQPTANAPDPTDTTIQTASIDEQLHGQPVTLIKLDIEGAETEALRGAALTIEKYAPKLVISIYHQPQDLYAIALQVKALRPEYKLYIRHLSNYFDDTVLVAIA